MPARHGTTRRYADGCHCGPCKRAHADARSTTYANNQDRTSTAPRFGEPWTADEDQELMFGAGTLTERAVRLQRTRAGVDARLARLRATGGDDT